MGPPKENKTGTSTVNHQRWKDRFQHFTSLCRCKQKFLMCILCTLKETGIFALGMLLFIAPITSLLESCHPLTVILRTRDSFLEVRNECQNNVPSPTFESCCITSKMVELRSIPQKWASQTRVSPLQRWAQSNNPLSWVSCSYLKRNFPGNKVWTQVAGQSLSRE